MGLQRMLVGGNGINHVLLLCCCYVVVAAVVVVVIIVVQIYLNDGPKLGKVNILVL